MTAQSNPAYAGEQGHSNNNAALIALGGQPVNVDQFALGDIWVVDDATYADLNRDKRHVLEPDHFRSNTPCHNMNRARALMGEKLVVSKDGTRGFILSVEQQTMTATADGFFVRNFVKDGEKLFGRYDSPADLKERLALRGAVERFGFGDHEPTFALYVSSPKPWSEERLSPAALRRALERRLSSQTLGPAPVLGL
jgi:hypothetical protein